MLKFIVGRAAVTGTDGVAAAARVAVAIRAGIRMCTRVIQSVD